MSLDFQIGATVGTDVPDVATRITVGFTDIRWYFAPSEDGTYVLEDSTTLVAGTTSYSYNKTTASETEWWQFAFYGTTVGESPRSEPVPVGQPQSTRKAIRQGVGRRLRLMRGPYNPASVTDGDTIVISELIDPDAEAIALANWFARAGVHVRKIRASGGSGYVPASGTLNFARAFSPILDTNSEVELWKSREAEDPSVIIDEAMNRARRNLWYEESLFVTTTSGQTEYVLPRVIENRLQVKRVEYAGGTYPNDPMWAASLSSVTMEQGTPILSLPGVSTDLIRVVVNRFPDRMDSDADYWQLPLEWCIAETALAALDVLTVTTGKVDDVRDWRILRGAVYEECLSYRTTFYPTVEIPMEPPQ